jgi:UMF1 family MFS transporter
MSQASTPSYWRALATRERIGWIAYDWADSAFVLCVITVIGSAYFVGVFEAAAREAGELFVGPARALRVLGLPVTGEAAWSLLVGTSAAIVAFSSPFAGAIADGGGYRMRFLRLYCAVGVVCTLALFFPLPWWTVGLLILVANVGYEGAHVFYNAFLPDIARVDEQDQVSSAAYAFGYIGSVMVLILSLLLFTDFLLDEPVATIRTVFLMVGVWWGGFALITFLWVKERPPLRPTAPGVGALAAAWRELATTVRNVRRTPQAALFLLAFLLYNDGIATLISNVTPYALQNIYVDWERTQRVGLAQLIPAIILVQVVGFPGSIFCGWLATRIGQKRALYFTLVVYLGVVSYGQVVVHVSEFYVMAALIGLVQGGAQAISRSLYASFVPAGRNAEFFAFFQLSSKFSAMIGPLVYGGLLLLTGDTRLSLLSLSVFFVLGGLVLYFVDVDRARADALRYP